MVGLMRGRFLLTALPVVAVLFALVLFPINVACARQSARQALETRGFMNPTLTWTLNLFDCTLSRDRLKFKYTTSAGDWGYVCASPWLYSPAIHTHR